ncbi:TRAP transporter substrate-binding protein [Rhodovastum atsumiense]|nr:TRAP transporter substrate-binding protein [Rhodovastum atsumiense]CAH2602395.1 TRAP transporter substrate-binding protein [Rhodovastum atsumiense]
MNVIRLAVAVVAGMAWGGAVLPAGAVSPAVIDIASTFPGSMPILGDAAHGLARRVAQVSGGELALAFHEPGELVPAADTVRRVADGTIPAAWAGAGWFAPGDSAYHMFSSVPFGPGIGEYLAWLYHGGGLELAREMFHREGVHNIPCILIPPEASGWFRKEISTVADLRGLRMRFFGLGARVMEKLGATTYQLPPGEILPAMQQDRIDAAEFSLPSLDQPLQLYTAARFYYFPGWHQQATFFDLYVNKSLWERLPLRHQALLETACGEAMRDSIAAGEAAQWQAMKEMQAEGVRLKRWPPAILVAFEKAWNEVVTEESAKNPNFARVYASYAEFRANYAIWKHFSNMQ